METSKMRRICTIKECGKFLGWKECSSENDRKITHGFCAECAKIYQKEIDNYFLIKKLKIFMKYFLFFFLTFCLLCIILFIVL
jgi:hypothetical protein